MGNLISFFPNTQKEPLSILEIPLIIMDICLESSKNKIADCLLIADEVERYQGVLTLLWHPPIFNTLEYPESREIYIKINQHCQKKGAWIARARDIYEWISTRNWHTFSCDYDMSSKTCTIVPNYPEQDHFFTLNLPSQYQCNIHSGNAKIIRKEGNCVYIKTQNLQKNNEIIIGIA